MLHLPGLEALLSNQVFSGVAGAAVVSALLYQVRALPGRIWSQLKVQFSVTLTVYSEQDIFRQVDIWLGKHPSAAKSRRVTLAEWWDNLDDQMTFELTPGEGYHLLWEGRTPLLVNKTTESAANSVVRRQTITLTTPGRSRKILENLLADVRNVQDRDVVPIYVWVGYGYQLIERRRRRSLDTIHLGSGLRDIIVQDAKNFISRASWYGDRGIPHRRGYLFKGAPGTGKSSMALALAGELRRALYVINPSTVEDDTNLQNAFNKAGRGVVLIEDIDAVDCSTDRTATNGAVAAASSPAETDKVEKTKTKTGISASGLLNAVDGVGAREGRILIITTNHPETLDPALLRPGRVDMQCEFSAARLPEALEMFRRFCPDGDEVAFARSIKAELPLSQAELQNRLIELALKAA